MITRIILFQCRVNGKLVDGKVCINDLLAEQIKHKRGQTYGRNINKDYIGRCGGSLGDRKDISRGEAVAYCGGLLWALYNDSIGSEHNHCQNQLSFRGRLGGRPLFHPNTKGIQHG